MTCIEAQAMITPFIQDKLNIEQLEAFLQHVNNCPSCMEELEIYYAVLMAMRQLDEDKELSNNYLDDLKKKLVKSDEMIRRSKLMKVRRRVLLIATILLVGIFSGIQLGERVVEEVNGNKEPELTGTCSFRLAFQYFDGENDAIELMFKEHTLDLIRYVRDKRHPEPEFTEDVIRDNSWWNLKE